MKNFLKYFLLYILIYFIVDFTTGFNSDIRYWISVNGPILGLIVYTLSGLLFYYIIYKKELKERTIFLVALAYGLLLEILFFKNPLVTTFPALIGGIPLTADIYGLIVLLPKWIVNKELKKHKILAIVMIAIWLFLAILAFFNNPHKI